MKLLELVFNAENDIELLENDIDAATAQRHIQSGVVPEVVKVTNNTNYRQLSYVLIHDTSNVKEYKVALITKTMTKLNGMITSLINTKQKLEDAKF